MKRITTALIGLLLVCLFATPAYGQTQGTRHFSSPGLDLWTITIASGDSISSYVTMDGAATSVEIYIPTITAGGIVFETSMDTRPGSGITLATFQEVMTVGAVIDSVATSTGAFNYDCTSQVVQAQFFRVHVGFNSAAAQAAERTFYVAVKKRLTP
jgi:hypothetical protein